ncbi:hypothetical protein U9M48_007242 [Paspalum notatum var. saurae]|uniref:Uncharacterized protein n=1 Tax=Paspalum notatum var. saurae TaxID=547442 RepID=A0AAQ3PWA1_PASNO
MNSCAPNRGDATFTSCTGSRCTRVVEDVQVLLLVVAYDGTVIPSVDSKAGEAAGRVLELKHVVLPRQVQRRAVKVQRELRHIRFLPPRRREAELREQRRRRVVHGQRHLSDERVVHELVHVLGQQRHAGARVDDRAARPVLLQRERRLGYRQPRGADGDALQRQVVRVQRRDVLDERGGLDGAAGAVAVEVGRKAE